MNQSLYLGIDGGQSHTEAVIADRLGRVLGRGRGGASNHAEQPGGRERLYRAVFESVNQALGSFSDSTIATFEFAAAHCAMTGGANFKEEIISNLIRARVLQVAHDAPAALAGATAGLPGVVVIAGTGSVAYGETATGKSLTVGGWGHLFGDEGSGYWIALEALRCAMRAADGLAATTVLGEAACRFFGAESLSALALEVYGEKITRDALARFTRVVEQAATEGDAAARVIIADGARYLARLACAVIKRLSDDEIGDAPYEMRVAMAGGVFRSALMREAFAADVRAQIADAQVIQPRFDPAIGALLLAFRAANIVYDEQVLANLNQPL